MAELAGQCAPELIRRKGGIIEHNIMQMFAFPINQSKRILTGEHAGGGFNSH